MCRPTTVPDHHEGSAFFRPTPGLDIRAFYLRLSSAAPAPAPAELTLVYLPAIGGAALGLNGRALPPAAPAEVRLRQAAGDASPAYASADRVHAADGARFEVFDGKDRAAEGVFRRRPGGGWRLECRRATPPAAASVAEVVVLAEGGVLMRDKPRPSRPRGMGCGATRLEGIPEDVAWGCDCDCGSCGDEDWEVVADDTDGGEVEMETVRWAMEMGVWAVCLGVGLLATARRFRRKRAFW